MRRVTSSFLAAKRLPWVQVVKVGFALAVSWIIAAAALQVETPIFAAIAAVIVVGPSIHQTFTKAIERTVGVIVGVIIAAVVAWITTPTGPVVLLTTFVALLIAWAIKATPGALNQMVISAMLVLILGGSSPLYAVDRILETIIGAIVGFAVNALIAPPVAIQPAREQIALLGSEVANSLDRLAEALERTQHPVMLQTLMIEVRLLRPMQERASESIRTALDSLELNPRGGRHREELEQLSYLLDHRLHPIVTQVIGMTRAFVDQYVPTISDEPAVPALAEQFRRAAHDVRLAGHLAEADPHPLTSAIPALTAPLELRPPAPEHWVLLGSMMEDLRRIRGELLEETEAAA